MKKLRYLILIFLSPILCYGQNQKEYFNDSAIEQNRIFLLGETHGIQSNFKFAREIMTELKEKTNFRYYLAEYDFAAGILLNEAIKNRDTLGLKEIILSFSDTPARCVENYEFYKFFIELNDKYEDDIQILGVDIAAAGHTFTKEVLEKSKDTFVISYLQKNWEHTKVAFTAPDKDWNRIRDAFIYENFQELVNHFVLQNEMFFGVWGYDHVYKSSSMNVNWFASQLQANNYKVYSISQYYINSTEMAPWHFYNNKPDEKVFHFSKWTNVSGKSLREYKNRLSEGESIFLTSELEAINTSDFISQNKSDSRLTDYLDAVIVTKQSGPTTVLGSNEYKSK